MNGRQLRKPKVLFVAAPLEGRSGVYRSTHDLVSDARSKGYDWQAIIGMRSSAPRTVTGPVEGVREFVASRHGLDGVAEIAENVGRDPFSGEADAIVTLITQSDLALAGMRQPRSAAWIAYLRGLPWPAKGEDTLPKRVIQHHLEVRALRQADAVWATTEVLAGSVRLRRQITIVPAGVPWAPRDHYGEIGDGYRAVWAGRYARDKQPMLFADAVRICNIPSVSYGSGPLEEQLRHESPTNLRVEGWVDPSALWEKAAVFAGTSYREAFGRSAVEAALRGVPTLIGSDYGAAPLLVTDDELRPYVVLPANDPAVWARALQAVWSDTDLRKLISDHVHENATRLTISASVDRIAQEVATVLDGSKSRSDRAPATL